MSSKIKFAKIIRNCLYSGIKYSSTLLPKMRCLLKIHGKDKKLGTYK